MNRSSSSSSSLFGLPAFAWRLILAAAVVAAALLSRAGAQTADCVPATFAAPPAPPACPPVTDSWVFLPSRFTHDPATGARVAQYAMKPPIEPLDDPRRVTSGYSRSRLILRGGDGSVDTVYRVQNFGNGRGGMDAEWERFHDAWRGSTIAGGDYQVYPGGYGYGYGYGGGPYDGGYGGGYGTGGGYGGYIPPWAYRGGYPRPRFGPGTGAPDAGRLDPDGADGFREPKFRTPNREFYFDKPARDIPPPHDHHGHGHGGYDD